MKASMRKTQSSSDTTMTPLMAAGTRLSTSVKGKQPAKSSKAKGYDSLKLSEAQILWDMYHKKNVGFAYLLWEDFLYQVEHKDVKKSNEMYYPRFTKFDAMLPVELTNEDIRNSAADKEYYAIALGAAPPKTKASESFDHIVQTPSQVENSDNESNDDAIHGMNVGGEEGPDAEDDDEELYRDVNINLEGIDSLFEIAHRVDIPVSTTVVPLLVTTPTLPPPFIPIMSQVQQAPAPTPTTAPSTFLQDLLNFGSLFEFEHRLKTLEANFSEFMQTNQFTEAISFILEIVDRDIYYRMNEAVKVAIQL
nr:hypothetical protein [Tanacetum cinerariifolium]